MKEGRERVDKSVFMQFLGFQVVLIKIVCGLNIYLTIRG